MELYRELLLRAHLSVISAVPDREIDSIAQIIQPSVRVLDRTDLEILLGRLLEAVDAGAAVAPKTLDLVGHSSSASLLRLGDWVIDAARPRVTAFFRGLADHEVMQRLGVRALRLLACNTASTTQGRSTLCVLADVLGIDVLGTNHVLYDRHYDRDGFRPIWEFMLASAEELRPLTSPPALPSEAERWPRTLDIDALPAGPLIAHQAPWPQRIATASAVRQILAVIRRNAGARMPGLSAFPSYELALPSATRGAYHLMHVLFDGTFVRCFPDGVTVPGVVYPVDDASQLHRIVDELPLRDLGR